MLRILRHWLLAFAVAASGGSYAFGQASSEIGADYQPGQWRAVIDREAARAAADLWDEAQRLERSGRHEGALAAYRQLIAGSPAGNLRATAVERAARLHHTLGLDREAKSLYEQLLEEAATGSDHAAALAAIAAIDAAAGDSADAAASYAELVAKYPQSPHAPKAAYWLARWAADEKDTVQARHHVRWLRRELDPERYAPLHDRQLWAQAVALECQLAAAERDWNLVQDVASATFAYLPPGAERARVEWWWAEAEFRTGQFDAARDRFAALDDRTAGVNEDWVALVPLRRAQLAARRSQWIEVLKFVERIDRQPVPLPLAAEVEYVRGRALAGRGEMAASRAAYQEVINYSHDADPETVLMAQWRIAESYFEQRAYPQARAAYKEVIESNAPADWQARAALEVGKCYELQDQWDEAQAMYERALRTWPSAEYQPQLEARLKWAEGQGRLRK